MSNNAAPIWFRNCIKDGMKALMTLRLDGTPAADTIVLTRDVWIQVLWPVKDWDESFDAQRIHQGFMEMMVKIERWPAPKHLLMNLPPREKLPAIGPVKISKAQQKKNLQRLRATIQSVWK